MDVRGIQRPATLAARVRQASAEHLESMRGWTKREPKPAKKTLTNDTEPKAAPEPKATKPPEPKRPAKQAETETKDESGSEDQPVRKRRFWQRAKASSASEERSDANARSENRGDDGQAELTKHSARNVSVDVESLDEEESSKPASKWKFWGRKSKSADSEDESEEFEQNEVAESDSGSDDAEPKVKRSWLPKWKRKPKAVADDESGAEDESAELSRAPESDDEAVEAAPKKRRFGLKFPSLGRKAKSDPSEDESQAGDEVEESGLDERADSRSSDHSSSSSDSYDDSQTDYSEMNEEDIDWSSMSKAERRRVRKQLKRSGRAA
jgi:hypothetical protein